MAHQSIREYHRELDNLVRFGGSKNEGVLEHATIRLLNEYAQPQNLRLVPKISIRVGGKTVIPDGTLKDALQLDWGYWEAKDEHDDLEAEIKAKFEKGYPSDNILFEDSRRAVLYQGGQVSDEADMRDEAALHRLLERFVNYERPEVQSFREAIERFKADVPQVTEAVRGIIGEQEKSNAAYQRARDDFWEICKESINPEITSDDIREMMVQHILTEDIFNTIFDETQFHRENNIARELEHVIATFFTRDLRRSTLDGIQHYYQVINARAAQIPDHHEKQKFLKVIYEAFYKGYNPKAADRLGIVYTPNEVVRFMVESTNYLLEKHFQRNLEDPGVEILDPATGTGTFICDIIDFISPAKLERKYREEIHANEIAILPYCIANLNIEYTYKQRMGRYAEYQNLCFVDTLDNLGFGFGGKQTSLFSMSAENAARIKKQNERKISVIIGNPPYNANQMSENDNNKNREYFLDRTRKTGGVDGRIKDTFIKHSTAQKTKVYDMYARFYRWAFDRLGDEGVVAFITNRSFIDSRTFDGFRKSVAGEFSHVYIVDLGGDVRANPKLSGTKHNVFGIQTGVAIMFLVRKNNRVVLPEGDEKALRNAKREYSFSEKDRLPDVLKEPVVEYGERRYLSADGCRILYIRQPEFDTAADKLRFLAQAKFDRLDFDVIRPDKNHNWVNIAEESDWESLMPICSKEVKVGKGGKAIFELFSLGVVTNRDEWVYDFDKDRLAKKVEFLIKTYNFEVDRLFGKTEKKDIKDKVDYQIKWTRAVKNDLDKGRKYAFQPDQVIESLYRPFCKRLLYFNRDLNEMQYQMPQIFGAKGVSPNRAINWNVNGMEVRVLASNILSDLHFIGDNQCLPLYRYLPGGQRTDNITDWALEQFRARYAASSEAVTVSHRLTSVTVPITKESIFHYVYAVLHCPAYRAKYELNLRREFPRIPLYEDFEQWSAWGKSLMDLHLGYETAEMYPLVRLETKKENPKVKLKADRETGTIALDEATALAGIPPEAWDYKLGNRSALDWVLDQYKESKPKDPTIAEQFDTYRFVDYKEKVVDLLCRVCTVSVETMRVVEAMPKE